MSTLAASSRPGARTLAEARRTAGIAGGIHADTTSAPEGNSMKKTIIGAAFAVLTAAGLSLGAATAAQAHDASADLDCSGWWASASAYPQDATGTVVADGVTIHDGTFGGAGTLSGAWSTVADSHRLQVTIVSPDGWPTFVVDETVTGCAPVVTEPPVETPPVVTPPAEEATPLIIEQVVTCSSYWTLVEEHPIGSRIEVYVDGVLEKVEFDRYGYFGWGRSDLDPTQDHTLRLWVNVPGGEYPEYDVTMTTTGCAPAVTTPPTTEPPATEPPTTEPPVTEEPEPTTPVEEPVVEPSPGVDEPVEEAPVDVVETIPAFSSEAPAPVVTAPAPTPVAEAEAAETLPQTGAEVAPLGLVLAALALVVGGVLARIVRRSRRSEV